MFNNEKDFMIAMLEGRKFTYLKENYTFWYDDTEGFLMDPEDAPRPVFPQELHDWCNKVTEVIEPKWYDNIPTQGILCWVTTTRKLSSTIRFINDYKEGKDYPFYCWLTGQAYKEVTPLTKEEVMQFIYQG